MACDAVMNEYMFRADANEIAVEREKMPGKRCFFHRALKKHRPSVTRKRPFHAAFTRTSAMPSILPIWITTGLSDIVACIGRHANSHSF